nr:immunoglobulin heavy chain junction region [Macaca mulatta]MOX06725.1 immunoglobulin heavy chain junction region [Macaca mulatta]
CTRGGNTIFDFW